MSPVPSSSSLTESLFFSILDSDVGCDSEAAIWSNFFFNFISLVLLNNLHYHHLSSFMYILNHSYTLWVSLCCTRCCSGIFLMVFPFALPFATCQVIPAAGCGNGQISARKLGFATLQPSLGVLQTSVSHVLQKSSNIHVCMQKIISRLLLNSNIRIPTPQLWRLWLSWKFLKFLTRIDWQLTSRPKCSWKSETNFWLSLLQNHLRLTAWLHSVLLPKV